MLTKEQIKSGLDIIRAVADAIKEAKEIPSGHLYAMMMNHICLAEYEKIIGILKNAGIITEKMNLLKWNIA